MKSHEFDIPLSERVSSAHANVPESCPITVTLADVLNRQDADEINRITAHVDGCSQCKAFVERNNAETSNSSDRLFTWGNFARGLLGITGVTLFAGLRGLSKSVRNTFNDTMR